MPDGSLPYWPRALREGLAAAYVGLSATTFRQVVARDVGSIRLTAGRVAWLREDLDAWLDKRRPIKPTDERGSGDDPPAALESFNVKDAIAAGLANLSTKRGTRGPRKAR